MTIQDSPLKSAEFCLVDFPDFITPERQWSSIAGIGTPEREKLRSVAAALGDDAPIKIHPSPHRIVFDSGDGWNIALTKDEQQTRGLVSHTGLVTKPKPRWDVHLQYIGDWAGILAEILRPLIARRCGSGL